MANHTTGAQRYNARMHKIFEEAKILNAKYERERALKTVLDFTESKDVAPDGDIGKAASLLRASLTI